MFGPKTGHVNEWPKHIKYSIFVMLLKTSSNRFMFSPVNGKSGAVQIHKSWEIEWRVPSRTPVSMRVHWSPCGVDRCSSGPAPGRKSLLGSSAYILASKEWPCNTICSWERGNFSPAATWWTKTPRRIKKRIKCRERCDCDPLWTNLQCHCIV